jgi:glycosyltransferase involved in cell wall biosynthesis
VTTPANPSGTTDATRPLKVLIGTDTFYPNINGAARFTERLAAGLVQRGLDVHVVAPGTKYRRTPPAIEVIEGEEMMVHRLPSVRWLPHDWLRFVWPFRSKYWSRRVLSRVEPDVVHIQSHIVIGRGLTRIARQRGIPVIATNHVMAENILDHTTLPEFLNKIFLKLAWADAKRTFDMARKVTTPTRRAAEFLESTLDIEGVIPISCGIDRTNYKPVIGPRTENRALFVGRLTAEKHVNLMLDAMTKIDPELNLTLDIVGGGDQRHALENMAKKLGLGGRVNFLGRVSDEVLRDLYSNATVFVIASIAELQSIATMEAMASALPVVAADAMALPHLVHPGENGYLFEPGNVSDLVEKLTAVLTASDKEYVAMQKASLDGVEIHDINKTLDTFIELYRGEPIEE